MESHCHRRSDRPKRQKFSMADFWRGFGGSKAKRNDMGGGGWMVRLGNHSSQVASILLPSNILNSMAVTATSFNIGAYSELSTI
eukprot:scaffold4958_cov145-Skeletonema_marinoi.AAC.32